MEANGGAAIMMLTMIGDASIEETIKHFLKLFFFANLHTIMSSTRRVYLPSCCAFSQQYSIHITSVGWKNVRSCLRVEGELEKEKIR